MALTRRGLGLGLLATGIGGTAGVALLGPERIERAVTGAGPDPSTLWGFIGGEKVDFVRNPKVRALLSRRYGLALDARRAGSIEMVGDPALTRQQPPWLWPAHSVMTQMARSNGLPVRRDEVVFTSPLVLYSWTPVVAALETAGFVERQGGIHTVRMAPLMEAIERGLAWRDLGVPELYGRAVVTTTDPTRSNSGFSFAALLANLFAGEVASPESLARDGARLRSVFARMGYKEASSGTHWNSYLTEGMGGKPLIAAYESQLVEFILANPARWASLQSAAVRPVMLYPTPTVTSVHPIISLTAQADRLVEALTDPELQDLAWSEHGFRGRLGAVGRGGPAFEGLSPSPAPLMPMPDAPTMLTVVDRLRTPT
ncbi:hypothetical protein [Methylobacterium sp. Leaf118]|uniref:hypothetical protein n=1 Tax=Methylobacterium sp. Leaf118 TaxID=2876562 RepID=UPI001E5786C2|nr:hypothetical protein [Methylobacterium sp. Leaf118]